MYDFITAMFYIIYMQKKIMPYNQSYGRLFHAFYREQLGKRRTGLPHV